MEDTKKATAAPAETKSAIEVKAQNAVNEAVDTVESKTEAAKKEAAEKLAAAQKKAMEEEKELEAKAQLIRDEYRDLKQEATVEYGNLKKEAAGEYTKFKNEASEKLNTYGKKAGEYLSAKAGELNAESQADLKKADELVDEFQSRAGGYANEFRGKAMNEIDHFSSTLEEDPKAALVEAAKVGLMAVGAFAILKAIFGRH